MNPGNNELESFKSIEKIIIDEADDEKLEGDKRWRSIKITNKTNFNVDDCYTSLLEVRNKIGDKLQIKLPVHLGWSGGGKAKQKIGRGESKNFDLVKASGAENKIYITSIERNDFEPLNQGEYFFDVAIGGDIDNQPIRRKLITISVLYNRGLDVSLKIIKEGFENEQEENEG